MYIAMNRFRIANDKTYAFIEIWKSRESHLNEVPGFHTFKLLQGPGSDKGSIFISHSTWDSVEAFEAWKESEQFKKAHAGPKPPKDIFLGPPEFEGFEVVL
ncbi:Heme-degrading monooxygenase, staphylobilin-producing [hydrothermal vent metagenome]|uniref:Heme-degrading monooxygenase, staphylobilin-producing n=1 Tax=hydrothermal vent metagenome TaxID=652676 RepID=A0A3B1DH67_9ZZZZ